MNLLEAKKLLGKPFVTIHAPKPKPLVLYLHISPQAERRREPIRYSSAGCVNMAQNYEKKTNFKRI
jgi:hypothetical protein